MMMVKLTGVWQKNELATLLFKNDGPICGLSGPLGLLSLVSGTEECRLFSLGVDTSSSYRVGQTQLLEAFSLCVVHDNQGLGEGVIISYGIFESLYSCFILGIKNKNMAYW